MSNEPDMAPEDESRIACEMRREKVLRDLDAADATDALWHLWPQIKLALLAGNEQACGAMVIRGLIQHADDIANTDVYGSTNPAKQTPVEVVQSIATTWGLAP